MQSVKKVATASPNEVFPNEHILRASSIIPANHNDNNYSTPVKSDSYGGRGRGGGEKSDKKKNEKANSPAAATVDAEYDDSMLAGDEPSDQQADVHRGNDGKKKKSSSSKNNIDEQYHCYFCCNVSGFCFIVMILILLIAAIVPPIIVNVRQQQQQFASSLSSGDDETADDMSVTFFENIDESSAKDERQGHKGGSNIPALSGWKQIGEPISYDSAPTAAAAGNVALSRDGSVLAIAEPDTHSVRIFDVNDEETVQRGEAIVLERDCAPLEVHKMQDLKPRGGVRGRRRRNADADDIFDSNIVPCLEENDMSVSLSADGNVLAVGGVGHDQGRGIVRVYKWQDDKWAKIGQALMGENELDGFGSSLDLSADGMTIVVSASAYCLVYDMKYFDGSNSHSDASSVNGIWSQRRRRITGKEETDEISSCSIADDKGTIAVGASNEAYVSLLSWDDATPEWTELASFANGATRETPFGSSIAFSNNGNVLAVYDQMKGDDMEGTSAANVIFVYETGGSAGDWERRDIIKMQAAAVSTASSPFQVDISDDGSVIAVASSSGVEVYIWGGGQYIARESTAGINNPVEMSWNVALSGTGESIAVSLMGDDSRQTSIHRKAN